MDNLGKDIRTVASGVVGVSDSAKVYAVRYEMRTGLATYVDSDYTQAIEFALENSLDIPILKK